jgi:hypothetical protein
MVWIALILLALTTSIVAVNTAANRWGMNHWRSPRGTGLTFEQWWLAEFLHAREIPSWIPPSVADAVLGAWQAVLDRSGFFVFSNWIVFSVFLSFLLPIWSLSFATEALGGEQESRSLVWLISISFYTRCLMFESLEDHGMQPPEKASVYLPVDGNTAWWVLVSLTIVFLIVGMLVFSRAEYHEAT